MSTLQAVSHLTITIGLLAAYVVLTVLNHDGTALLGALGGYLGGAGVAAVSTRGK